MGSGCSSHGSSSKRKRKNSDFDLDFEKFAPKIKQSENFVLKNGLRRQISEISEELSGRYIESRIDWENLERNIQQENLKHLREDLHTNPQRFLVNQILLSVQFFKNYEK